MDMRKIRPGALRSTLAVVVCMGLYGCGGGSEGGSGAEPSAPSTAPVNQTDFWFTAVQPESSGQGDYSAVIDLARNFSGVSADLRAQVPYIKGVSVAAGGDGGGVCLSASTIAGQDYQFTVDLDNVNHLGTCQFDVSVMRDGITEERKLIADFTNTPRATIPAISQALHTGASITINLAEGDTASFITAGYALSSNAPEVLGDLVVTASSNTLTVTASNIVGPNRIVYQLVKGGESKTGVIDVTVSDAAIEAPTININNWEYLVATKEEQPVFLLTDGTETGKNSGIVHYGTHKQLQIIDLKTPEGGVATITGNLPTDLSFKFSSDQVGEYPINFTVSDHHGGYASGTVIVNVGLLTSPNTEQANNPGRMVERIVLNDGGKRLLVNRPQLLVEMQDIYPGLGSGATSISGETWGYLNRVDAEAYCAYQNKKLITEAAFKQILADYSDITIPQSITHTLGWPGQPLPSLSTGGMIQYHYHVREATAGQAINAYNGRMENSTQAIPLCVFDPVEPFVPTP